MTSRTPRSRTVIGARAALVRARRKQRRRRVRNIAIVAVALLFVWLATSATSLTRIGPSPLPTLFGSTGTEPDHARVPVPVAAPLPVPRCDTMLSPSQNVTAELAHARSGQVVCLRGGTYHQQITVLTAGLTVVNAPRQDPAIDGSKLNLDPHDGLVDVDANGVTLQGITIRNSAGRGLVNFGSRNRIVGNKIQNTYNAGLLTTNLRQAATGNVYTRNDISKTVQANDCHSVHDPCAQAGGWESAINQYDLGDSAAGHNTYTANTIYENAGEGATAMDGDEFIGNVFHDNFGAEIYLDGVQQATVEQNIIYESEQNYLPIGVNGNQSYRLLARGIGLADEVTPRSAGNMIEKNLIVNTRDGIQYWHAIANSGLKNDVIVDNTIVNTWDYGLSFDPGSHSGTVVRGNVVVPRQGHLTRGLPQFGIAEARNVFAAIGSSLDPRLAGEGTFSHDPADYRFTPAP